MTFVCTHCKEGDCGACMDVFRAAVSLPPLCYCKRKKHSGEPENEQIADPFDGSVHGPGATISKDGEVSVDADWKRQFVEQFEGTGEE